MDARPAARVRVEPLREHPVAGRPLTDLLPDVAGTQLVAFVLVLARLGGLFAIGPIFSSRVIPARARALAALALALALTPLATHGRTVPGDVVDVAAAIVTEAAVGLAFALAVAVVVAGVSAAASLADTITGFGLGSLVDPVTNASGSVFGQFYSLFATLILLLTGGDHLLIAGLVRTYDLVPLGGHLDTAATASLAADGLARVFVLAFEVGAPILVAVFLTDIGFGIVARAVPQMNVLVVGLPAKILVAFTTSAAALPLLAFHLTDNLGAALERALAGLGP